MDRGSAGIFAGPWIEEATSPFPRWTHVLLVLLLGAVLGSGLTALTSARSAGAPAEPAAVAREWPRHERSIEWRWVPGLVKYEHMFRKGAGASTYPMFRRR